MNKKRNGKLFASSKIGFYQDLTGHKKSASLKDGWNRQGWNKMGHLINVMAARGADEKHIRYCVGELERNGYLTPEESLGDTYWINLKMLPKELQFSDMLDPIAEYFGFEI